ILGSWTIRKPVKCLSVEHLLAEPKIVLAFARNLSGQIKVQRFVIHKVSGSLALLRFKGYPLLRLACVDAK
ncbi:MAG: hypothetical protein Q9224_005069, partial [Gallowayella concinna]